MLCTDGFHKVSFDSNCNLSSITSWFHKCTEIINNGSINNIRHCWIDYDKTQSILKRFTFENNGNMTIHGYLCMNMTKITNNGEINCDILYHINAKQYVDNRYSITNIKNDAYLNIDELCHIQGSIYSNILIFEVEKLNLSSKRIECKNSVFINCSDLCVISNQAFIQIGSNSNRIKNNDDLLNDHKLYGHSDNNAAKMIAKCTMEFPTFYIKSPKIDLNNCNINDLKTQSCV